jgi:hypothetical protein
MGRRSVLKPSRPTMLCGSPSGVAAIQPAESRRRAPELGGCGPVRRRPGADRFGRRCAGINGDARKSPAEAGPGFATMEARPGAPRCASSSLSRFRGERCHVGDGLFHINLPSFQELADEAFAAALSTSRLRCGRRLGIDRHPPAPSGPAPRRELLRHRRMRASRPRRFKTQPRGADRSVRIH